MAAASDRAPDETAPSGGLHRFANPLRFQKIADAVFPWVAGATAILAPVALWRAMLACRSNSAYDRPSRCHWDRPA